jgi:hypothetical protein
MIRLGLKRMCGTPSRRTKSQNAERFSYPKNAITAELFKSFRIEGGFAFMARFGRYHHSAEIGLINDPQLPASR